MRSRAVAGMVVGYWGFASTILLGGAICISVVSVVERGKREERKKSGGGGGTVRRYGGGLSPRKGVGRQGIRRVGCQRPTSRLRSRGL